MEKLMLGLETTVKLNAVLIAQEFSDHYYMDSHPQQNGDYEVHKANCPYLPTDARDLGVHRHSYTAMVEARKVHPISNGCLFCCKESHRDV